MFRWLDCWHGLSYPTGTAMDEKTRSVKIWQALWIGFIIGTATQVVWFLSPQGVPMPWMFSVIMLLPTASVFAWLSDKLARNSNAE